MTAPILQATDLVKTFGGLSANDGMSLAVQEGNLHALIGPNGAGKSTTINLLSGETKPDSGTIRFDGQDITKTPAHKRTLMGLSRSYQVASLFPEFTALDNVAMAIQAKSGHAFQFFTDARKESALRHPAMEGLEQLGLVNLANSRVSDLAHGQRRQVELAMVLATAPKTVLLDEPMAGMGRAEREDITQFLSSQKGQTTILLVEHDMDIVFALADTISVMVKGKLIATGTPAEIRANPEVQAAYLGEDQGTTA